MSLRCGNNLSGYGKSDLASFDPSFSFRWEIPHIGSQEGQKKEDDPPFRLRRSC